MPEPLRSSVTAPPAALSQPLPPLTAPEPRPRWSNLRRAAAAVLLLGIWWACLWMYTKDNRLPYTWHPDEPGKTAQVMSGMRAEDGAAYRNFNHPQLMLEATQWAVRWLGTEPSPQAIVVVGRTVSAACCAVGVVAFGLALYLCGGGVSGMLAGAAAGALCPMLLAHSHAMKEDASLAGGLMLTVLAARCLWAARSGWGRTLATLFLGVAAGAAASGKYVGIAAAAFALPAVLIAPSARWYDRLLRPVLLAAAMAVTVAAVNHRIYADWETWNAFLSAFEVERRHSETEHMGITMDRPNGYFLSVAREQTPLTVQALVVASPLVLLAGLIAWAVRRRRGDQSAWRPDGWDVLVVALPCLLLWVTSHSVIAAPRYALPAVVTFWFTAAACAVWVGRVIGPWWARVAAPLAFVAAVAVWSVPRQASYVRQFGDDSRHRLREWVLKEVPAGSTIAADGYAALSYPPPESQNDGLLGRVNLVHAQFVPDLGDLASLRVQGVDYVVIADLAYSRFMHPYAKPAPGDEYAFEYRKKWYATLLNDHKPVWQNDPDYAMSGPMSGFNNPRLRVYRIGK